MCRGDSGQSFWGFYFVYIDIETILYRLKLRNASWHKIWPFLPESYRFTNGIIKSVAWLLPIYCPLSLCKQQSMHDKHPPTLWLLSSLTHIVFFSPFPHFSCKIQFWIQFSAQKMYLIFILTFECKANAVINTNIM